jgi:hypothetical protein
MKCSHFALVVNTFLAKHSIVEISHTPYFLISHQIFFVFPTLKTPVKGKRFQEVEDFQKNETAELNAVPLEASAVFKNF